MTFQAPLPRNLPGLSTHQVKWPRLPALPAGLPLPGHTTGNPALALRGDW